MPIRTNKGPSLSTGFLHHLGVGADGAHYNDRKARKEYRHHSRTSQKRQISRKHPRKYIEHQKHDAPSLYNTGTNIDKRHSKSYSVDLEASGESEEDEKEFGGFDISEEELTENNNADKAAHQISRRASEALEQNDAEIAELERKLGIKGHKHVSKLFNEDGLGDIFDSLNDVGDEDVDVVKGRKRKAEVEEWLRMKRRKSTSATMEGKSAKKSDDNNDDDGKDVGSDEDGLSEDEGSQPVPPMRRRENPYVAPVPSPTSQKYVPPARRQTQEASGADSEGSLRVRRQAHHLIARLSDANLTTILGEVEKLFMEYPRQHVTSAVVDKLLEQVIVDGALSNNVIILVAGFAAALYHIKGIDIGAHFIQKTAELFKQNYDFISNKDEHDESCTGRHSWAPSSKTALNLLALIAEAYNFRMVGSNLMFDYVRLLLGSLTEINTELLLRLFETSGQRLRQDDPRALKNAVALIQPAVVRAGGEQILSARTRHMIWRINDLKKSEKKKSRDADTSGFGHAERIRKAIGNLANSRKLEATGPMRVSLSDIEQADSKGKWWLVGASWSGHGVCAIGAESQAVVGTGPAVRKDDSRGSGDDDDVLGSWADAVPDMDELDQLAREQGMNTDTRRSIFVALLSAADSADAHVRLLNLQLNKHNKREVVNVLIRCVGAEKHYNRYYALVARQVCNVDHRMSWVFRVSLWKLFRRMGEPIFGELPDEDDMDDDDEATDLRRIVNTAKMYGHLIACGCLGLDLLKCLDLFRLQTKTRMFVELLLIALFGELRKLAKAGGSIGGGTAAIIRTRFCVAKTNDNLRRGLQYFLEHVVKGSKLVEKEQAGQVAKGCSKALQAIAIEAGQV